MLLAAVAAASCRVSLPEDGLYSCSTDSDCGGDGYQCIFGARPAPFCCREEPEVCDGRDNDCNGVADEMPPERCYEGTPGTEGVGPCKAGTRACVDGALAACDGQVLPKEEVCDAVDDNCDGALDDASCPVGTVCRNGKCIAGVVETVCNDKKDDDNDYAIDCDDLDCANKSCGTGCLCRAQEPAEVACSDSQDNDADGKVDCADQDCDGATCGGGCACRGLSRTEANCRDGADNDGDGPVDCVDPDCLDKACRPAPETFRCTSPGACACGGVTSPPPESACGNATDDDCDGFADCADAECEGDSCGGGCLCKNKQATEKIDACGDLIDNDGDTFTDCADSLDCPDNTACQYLDQNNQLQPGNCKPSKKCQ